MLLYVHVPFCSRKCDYCAFHSIVPGPEDMPLYVEALLSEIVFWKERLENREIDSLYFGGGTPSLLSLKALASIVKAIEAAFEFEAGLEFSFEANPDSVVRFGYLYGLKAVGVNRLSLGVQSLYDRHLRTLGRAHDSEQALGAYYLARDAGFDNINLDLIWGLPGLRLSTWMTQLREVVRLKPNHLSCYGLTLEPDTPLEKQCREQDMDFAPD
ncbi:MAG: radical SAM protein, partial [Thermodesulfobacteriota bacterium]|nr:radical SAM protein [Thermodesulfobacteriota bacterium]